jgi:hypothetical protein
VIADLLRAFVEAVIVREIQPQFPGVKIDGLAIIGQGIHVHWSRP